VDRSFLHKFSHAAAEQQLKQQAADSQLRTAVDLLHTGRSTYLSSAQPQPPLTPGPLSLRSLRPPALEMRTTNLLAAVATLLTTREACAQCTGDTNGDQRITVEDIMQTLANFGNDCAQSSATTCSDQMDYQVSLAFCQASGQPILPAGCADNDALAALGDPNARSQRNNDPLGACHAARHGLLGPGACAMNFAAAIPAANRTGPTMRGRDICPVTCADAGVATCATNAPTAPGTPTASVLKLCTEELAFENKAALLATCNAIGKYNTGKMIAENLGYGSHNHGGGSFTVNGGFGTVSAGVAHIGNLFQTYFANCQRLADYAVGICPLLPAPTEMSCDAWARGHGNTFGQGSADLLALGGLIQGQTRLQYCQAASPVNNLGREASLAECMAVTPAQFGASCSVYGPIQAVHQLCLQLGFNFADCTAVEGQLVTMAASMGIPNLNLQASGSYVLCNQVWGLQSTLCTSVSQVTNPTQTCEDWGNLWMHRSADRSSFDAAIAQLQQSELSALTTQCHAVAAAAGTSNCQRDAAGTNSCWDVNTDADSTTHTCDHNDADNMAHTCSALQTYRSCAEHADYVAMVDYCLTFTPITTGPTSARRTSPMLAHTGEPGVSILYAVHFDCDLPMPRLFLSRN
jgi:hypothetical protein